MFNFGDECFGQSQMAINDSSRGQGTSMIIWEELKGVKMIKDLFGSVLLSCDFVDDDVL